MSKRRNVYTVHYRMASSDIESMICVIASNKEDAWDIATYEAIPAKEGCMAYSTWVTSVTYQNGNCHDFNTCEGLPY